MVAASRERRLGEVFVILADTLVEDFDVLDVWWNLSAACVELLDVDAAGLLISDNDGRLQAVALSDEDAEPAELFRLQAEHGPGRACFTHGEPVTCTDLAADMQWPQFSPRAHAAGYRSVCALPLRLREQTIGELTLFSTRPGPIPDADVRVAQSLADAATISILLHRAAVQNFDLTGQLQAALDGRVVIEQAKATLAERHGLALDEGFARLRGYARDRGLRLRDVARDTVEGTLDPGTGDRPAPTAPDGVPGRHRSSP